MKIPGMFIPEYKNLEQKTEQLLEKAKTVQEDVLTKKEKRLEEVLAQFDRPVESRVTNLYYDIIQKALISNGYRPRTPGHLQIGYWVKNVSSSEIKVFLKRCDSSDTPKDFGFASLRPEKLERFYKRYERYEREKRLGPRGIFGGYGGYRAFNYFLCSLVAGSFASLFLISGIKSHPSMLEILAGLVVGAGFFAGGYSFDQYCYNRNEKRMKGLCSYFTENDKEAVRRALI
ncbi:MAG: hypothetical protein Q8N77_03150 [Nanoarchaeota archaeon]|nr:hypothetical protein [Nanoarchaeota archaeon]